MKIRNWHKKNVNKAKTYNVTHHDFFCAGSVHDTGERIVTLYLKTDDNLKMQIRLWEHEVDKLIDHLEWCSQNSGTRTQKDSSV